MFRFSGTTFPFDLSILTHFFLNSMSLYFALKTVENNKSKKSTKFQGDMLIFCDFIQVFIFTTNHHLNHVFAKQTASKMFDLVFTKQTVPEMFNLVFAT